MRNEAIKRAQKAYVERLREKGVKTTKNYNLKCHLIHDEDIIKQLEIQDNKNGYIKKLIRDDIKNH